MRGPAACSFLLGVVLGSLNPSLLYSVERAQVISGVVIFPPHLPMAIHDGRVFSMLIDAAALLLHFGLDESIVCRLLSALMGGLAYLTMSFVAFAFTADRLAAFAAPILAHYLAFSPAAHKYPLLYPVTMQDLGANGFSFALLTLSLLVVNVRAGAFLLGLMPGIHVSLAAAVWLITGVGMAFDRPKARALIRVWRFTAIGISVVTLAWIAHQYFGPALPGAPPDADLRYARAFVTAWDFHRAPLGVANVAELLLRMSIDAVFLTVAVAALIVRPAFLAGVRFWVAGQVVVAIAAIGVTIADEFRSGWSPLLVSALMISRWLNLNTIVVSPLIAGWALCSWHQRARPESKSGGVTRLLRTAAVVVLAVVTGYRLVHAAPEFWPGDTPVREAARARQGVLLSAPGIPFAQLYTGRSLLLETDLHELAYVPGAGPGMERILTDVYHVSLLGPGSWEQFERVQRLWEGWNAGDWTRVKERYGVTDVLVPAEWNLKLPRVAADSGFALFSMPE